MSARHHNSHDNALTGVQGAELIRSADHRAIGEIFKLRGEWHAYAGYDIPAECRGSWQYRHEAIFAINEADRLYKGELNGACASHEI